MSEQHAPSSEFSFGTIESDEHQAEHFAGENTLQEWYAEKTCELLSTPTKSIFDPKEISARSTDVSPSASSPPFQNDKTSPIHPSNLANIPAEGMTPGLAEIFDSSICPKVRDIGEVLRNSIASSDLPLYDTVNTVDLSISSTAASRTGGHGSTKQQNPEKSWSEWAEKLSFSNQQSICSVRSEDFRPAEKEFSRLERDARAWGREFAAIPPQDSIINPENSTKSSIQNATIVKDQLKHIELPEFSGFLPESDMKSVSDSLQNLSIGKFFQGHTQNLTAIIPNKESPPTFAPVPLIEDSILTNDENKENERFINQLNASGIKKLTNIVQNSERPSDLMQKWMQFLDANQGKIPQQQQPSLTPKKSAYSDYATMSVTGNNHTERTQLGMAVSSSPFRPSLSSTVDRESVNYDTFETHLKLSQPKKSGSPQSVRTNSSAQPRSVHNHKPNGSPEAAKLIRTASQCSEYLFSKDGPFPVKSSRVKLSWTCVKLRTKNQQTLALKNFSEKRVQLRLSVNGPGFQLAQTDTETIVLQGNEIRSVVIDFCPTVIGPAFGSLCIQPSASSHGHARQVYLYGYGGKSQVELSGDLSIPPQGNSFISLGSLSDLNHTVERYVTVKNKGDIDGFAIFIPDLQEISSMVDDASIVVTPNHVVIPPGKVITVIIRIKLRSQDLTRLSKVTNSSVATVLTKLNVLSGDNAARQRIMLCIQKVRVNPTEYKSHYTRLSNNPNIDNVLKNCQLDSSMSKFETQPITTMDNLLETLKRQNIDLTISCDPEEAHSFAESMENTILFRTLTCEDLSRELEDEDNSKQAPISIEPSEIEVEPLRAVQFFMNNTSQKLQTFEISSDFAGLQVFPNEGEIQPGETIAINAKLKWEMPASRHLKITIMYERGRVILPVTIRPDGAAFQSF